MKLYTIFVAFFLALSFIAKGEEPTHLIVSIKDGTQIAYALAEEPQVTFEEGNLVLKSSEASITHELSSIEQITYGADATSSTKELYSDTACLQVKGNKLLIYNEHNDYDVLIYDSAASEVYSRKYKAAELAVIPISSYRTGVYIVVINGTTHKIAIR
jgi:hypothetical protein